MAREYALLALVALVATVLPMAAAQTPSPTAIVVIDENGVARVYMNVSVVEGVTSVVLPIKPVDVSIEISPDIGVEWLSINNSLYIVSPRNATLSISYIANVTVADGIFQLSVLQPHTIRLLVAPNILLLSIPNETVFGEVTDNRVVMEFKGPATIMYTVMSGATQTKVTTTTPVTTPTTTTTQTTSATPAPSTVTTKTTQTTQLISTTPTQSTTQIPQTTTSEVTTEATTYMAATPTTTTTPSLFSTPLVIGIAIAVLVVVAVLVLFLIKRR